MSNAEQTPAETVCETGDTRCGVEILEAREVPLGGIRAMPVRRTLPQRRRSLIGAWCFLDHYGPDDVSLSGGMDVAAHPHIGLQTVSWLFSGEIEHRDSAGFHAMVRPGEVNLMTAGRGISHSERSTPDTTVLHGAQLWVALPDAARHMKKTFEHYAPPMLSGADWRAQVFLGSLLGETSPVSTHSPLLGAEINLEPGAALEIALDQGFEHGILLDSGSLTIVVSGGSEPGVREAADAAASSAEMTVAVSELAYLPLGSDAVRLRTGDSGARLLLIGGEPLREQIIMWWNFVARSHDEIAQARADWQAQLAAAGVADVTPEDHPVLPDPLPESIESDRFGLPSDEPAPPLPAPPLPIAHLKPRG